MIWLICSQGPISSRLQIATPPFSNRLQGNNVVLTSLPLTFPSNTSALAYRPTDWNLKQPAMLVYNLAVERQLPFDTSLTVAYAGSQGRHPMGGKGGQSSYSTRCPFRTGCLHRTLRARSI